MERLAKAMQLRVVPIQLVALATLAARGVLVVAMEMAAAVAVQVFQAVSAVLAERVLLAQQELVVLVVAAELQVEVTVVMVSPPPPLLAAAAEAAAVLVLLLPQQAQMQPL